MSDPSAAVEVAPYVAILQPLVEAAVTAALGVFGSWAVYLAGRYLHVQISQAAVEVVVSKAQTVAGQMVAADAANLAGKSITISDPRIAAAANSIAAKLPEVLAGSGWTEDRIAKLVVGEIGKLQAQATMVSAARTPAKA